MLWVAGCMIIDELCEVLGILIAVSSVASLHPNKKAQPIELRVQIRAVELSLVKLS